MHQISEKLLDINSQTYFLKSVVPNMPEIPATH